MKKNVVLIGLSVLVLGSCNLLKKTQKEEKSENKLETATEKFSYSLGLSIGENLKSAGLDTIDIDLLTLGINDVLLSKELLINQEEASIVVQQYIADLENRRLKVNKMVEEKFLNENKQRQGVQETASGLQYEIIVKGEGPKPTIVDSVLVHYHGMLLDGAVFDSSVERGEPMMFPVASVIPGMQEAILLMTKGSKFKLYIPSNLAYGEDGAGGVIEPYSTLVFEMELIDIQ
ncbi:MAG: FKBP-type peptidyl-prolyl cis-trans isomerase [Bacteroidota bacterium]|nr:FKBP-type peptidyl-prolyl cis-trans isomerase [Bacteroidota bacterium]